jgi:hypothetical protein
MDEKQPDTMTQDITILRVIVRFDLLSIFKEHDSLILNYSLSYLTWTL